MVEYAAMKTLTALLLVAATALTPLTAAQAQRDGRGHHRADGEQRVPRGPELRQMDRREWQRGEARSERRNSDARVEPRSEWRRDAPRPESPRVDAPQPSREAWGRPGGAYDRNRDGQVDRRWDRNRNGDVDRRWDRNDNGRVDRQWDRNRNGDLDRRWDRNRDGNFDRRWDQNRDGRYDRYSHDNRRWDRQGWRNDRRYDWYGYRHQHRDHYRLGRYYAPHYGHRYSRFSIGFHLGPSFYSSRYWINDPWRYRLPEVYGPYRWVRYYDDVLLVDIYSGEVVDVIYNFFW
jgi:Nickel/cobalt transporter regulator